LQRKHDGSKPLRLQFEAKDKKKTGNKVERTQGALHVLRCCAL